MNHMVYCMSLKLVALFLTYSSVLISDTMSSHQFSSLTDLNVEKYFLPAREGDQYLAPLLDGPTMKQHYDGLFAKYTANLNAILNEWKNDLPEDKLSKDSVINILKKLDSVPEKYRLRVRKFAGGYVNHYMYFKLITPNKDLVERVATGNLLVDINKNFGSFSSFREEFTKSAMAVFGSGYTFLARNKKNELKIVNSSNQDTPLSDGMMPIVVLDLWEHAYYAKHEIRRNVYIEDWWKLVDFERVDLMAAHMKTLGHDEL